LPWNWIENWANCIEIEVCYSSVLAELACRPSFRGSKVPGQTGLLHRWKEFFVVWFGGLHRLQLKKLDKLDWNWTDWIEIAQTELQWTNCIETTGLRLHRLNWKLRKLNWNEQTALKQLDWNCTDWIEMNKLHWNWARINSLNWAVKEFEFWFDLQLLLDVILDLFLC
jgi:hypothetical protein